MLFLVSLRVAFWVLSSFYDLLMIFLMKLFIVFNFNFAMTKNYTQVHRPKRFNVVLTHFLNGQSYMDFRFILQKPRVLAIHKKTFTMDNVSLEFVEDIKNLGLIINHKLNWNSYIDLKFAKSNKPLIFFGKCAFSS